MTITLLSSAPHLKKIFKKIKKKILKKFILSPALEKLLYISTNSLVRRVIPFLALEFQMATLLSAELLRIGVFKIHFSS